MFNQRTEQNNNGDYGIVQQNVNDHTWVPTNVDSAMPPFAVLAGHDGDGDPIYVGRAYHNGEKVFAKVVPNKRQSYVGWGGEDHNKQDVEILTGHHYEWIPSSNGHVPPHALRVGQSIDGNPIYIGRGHWSGNLIPGKIYPPHGCLYISLGGPEVQIYDYEALVRA